MIQSKMIEKAEDFCCSMNHAHPIQLVVCDTSLGKNKKLLCSYCIDNLDSHLNNAISFSKASRIIEDNQKKKAQLVESAILMNLQQIQELKETLIQLKSKINLQLDEFIQNSTEWMQSLLNFGQQNVNYSFYEELDNIINQIQFGDFDCKALHNQIQRINYSWNKKISSNLANFKSFELAKKCQQFLFNLENCSSDKDQIQQINLIQGQQESEIVNQNQPDVNFRLIEDVQKQMQDCYAIVFNNTGSIMVSTDGQDILIWNFAQGQLKQSNRYRVHQLSHHVQCLVYSKRMNSFISGSWDKSIICWKQINSNEWQWSQQYFQHTNWVFCLILNKEEDQLISGGRDNQIIIWNVDLMKNELTFLQSLDNTAAVYSLSLNESETILVSCAKHNYLIWEKIDQRWQCKCKQSVPQGNQIYFMNNQQFLWVTSGKEVDQILIFELQNGTFEQNQDKTIQLNNNDQCENVFVNFPIIYNKDKKILLIRHKHSIYFIRRVNDAEFKILGSLDCGIEVIQGSMTNDAQYLVFLDRKKKKYTSYELLFR
ncbi:unnamed protein product (macronuclear) [Paramecium tetraurelia]|uniref:Uncharacterized protein n=1 Tax=Paramecium tetraurelia TaxID=5888 RepID=A0EF43_PARTE|nr:uncharacterized protein GSPATT00026257001 [Paramecium tetraurelia]CAK93934.1 unnamed protein product [Paramecium tetraurelia]|eukprot:XP_001461307.1 hypothetical protein (macronuclear) [Paramecium tetraurelia strain d4-2]